MAFPHLKKLNTLKFEPFQRYLDLYTTANSRTRFNDSVLLQLTEIRTGKITAQVKGSVIYEVNVSYTNQKVLHAACSCPYSGPGGCKHIIHVLAQADLHLIEHQTEKASKHIEVLKQDDYWLLPKMKVNELKDEDIQQLSLFEPVRQQHSYYFSGFKSGEYQFNHFSGLFVHEYQDYQVDIKQQSEGILLRCSCREQHVNVCSHLIHLLYQRNHFQFNLSFDLNNRLKQLKEVADQYGIKTESDKLEELFLIRIDHGVLCIDPRQNLLNVHPQRLKSLTQAILPHHPLPWEQKKDERITLILIHYNPYQKEFTIQLRKAKQSKSGDLKSPIEMPESLELLEMAGSTPEFLFVKALISWPEFHHLDPDSDHFDQKHQLGSDIMYNPFGFPIYYFDADGGKVTPQKLRPIQIKMLEAEVTLEIKQQGDFYILSGKFEFDNHKLSSGTFKIQGDLFVKYASKLYFFTNKTALKLYHFLASNDHRIFIHQSQFESFTESFLHPLEHQVSIQYSFVKKADKAEIQAAKTYKETEKLVYLSESDDFILLTPAMIYGDVEIPLLSKRNLRIQLPNGEYAEAERNTWEERGFLRTLKDLHPNFMDETPHEFYYLHRQDFLENGWFLDAFEQLRKHDIQILGFAQLSRNNFNANKASISTQIISGIDWFDVHVKVSFGKQEVRLQDLQKAVMNRNRFVKLDDGSQGILPQEWVNKFGHFFRSSEINGETFRTHKSHFQLIDRLFDDEIADEDLRLELKQFREKLSNFHSISNTRLPQKLKATLRDYQKEGLNWLNFLDDFGFGGCLADDMGLGKTVQIIAYLLQQVEKGNQGPNLIVVPTSLLFNWKAELKKFAPHLKYSELYGNNRNPEKVDYSKFTLVFTTYGTLLTDIGFLKTIRFNCIILDESQAIKNPESKRYKAVRLLNGRQRLVLTGTPIENNTFDLFAQLSFAQPGLLGSAKHFADVYSTPIDKFQDSARAKELQQKIHPFILRRTKKQVAKELPDKTEMVIHCEMGDEQKRIYEAYKKEFQAYLQGKSEDELNRNSMFILQGMMKLRQICNSPAILGDDSWYGNSSAKISELMNQIEEKKGQHKILVFSQFVTMLDLIRTELEQRLIPFCYLTGQSKDRQEQVSRFQNDDEIRVFLISLKAGGTGLNLTQADYVFLIDPWWNPAVENQAIDRAYRIGQEKHVVAVRLITPDTIEEKIRELQERKKELADDIIHTDTAVLKALKKEDLMRLL